jgi:putative DNA primase/helicase
VTGPLPASLEVAGVTPVEPDPDTFELLEKGKDGVPIASLLNLVTILDGDPAFSGRCRRDTFRLRTLVDGKPVRDEDETTLNVEIARMYGIKAPTSLVGEAVGHVGNQHPFHGVLTYLDGLVWDETPRIDTWLIDRCAAEDTPLVREIGRCFLLSAVARVKQPGCKVDNVLILVGPQGIGKSTAFSILGGEWFCDSAVDFASKDAYQQLPGVWIYELAELDSLRRAETSAIKAYISAQVDHYRPSYGRNIVDVPRQTIFVGSTNEIEFLRDPSGSRRFWPVAVLAIDLVGLAADRDQLWAEARVRFERGEVWWLSADAEAARAVASEPFREVDAWEEPVGRWAAERAEPFGIAEVLSGAVMIETGRQTKRDGMRVAGILGRLGFVKRRVRLGEGRPVMWTRPDAPEVA